MHNRFVLPRIVMITLVILVLSGCGAMGQAGAQVQTWWGQRAERRALVALYEATGGPNWGNNTGWLSNQPVCDWHGVRCADGYVAGLDLSGNHLSGAVPPEVGELRGLVELHLGGNQLVSLPSEIGQLQNLVGLWLGGNPLTSLPPEICQLRIETIDIDIRPLCGE